MIAVLTACSHRSGGLPGKYEVAGRAGEVVPPLATLQLSKDQTYPFCDRGGCAVGRWAVQPGSDRCEGRITFVGPAVEAYALALSRSAYGESPARRQRGLQQEIDLSYSACTAPAEITLAGDAAFVKC